MAVETSTFPLGTCEVVWGGTGKPYGAHPESTDCINWKPLPTRALSVRAPWWWYILHGGKDVENRDWSTGFRGTVLLHASKWWSRSEVSEDVATVLFLHHAGKVDLKIDGVKPTLAAANFVDMLRPSGGCIVGQVDIVDCVAKSKSPWFFGKYGFVLANPIAYVKPVPCKGALGFFAVPDEVLREISRPEVRGSAESGKVREV